MSVKFERIRPPPVTATTGAARIASPIDAVEGGEKGLRANVLPVTVSRPTGCVRAAADSFGRHGKRPFAEVKGTLSALTGR